MKKPHISKNQHGHCPNCKTDLDGEPIWQFFFKKTGSEKEATHEAKFFGATRTRGKFGRQIGICSLEKDRTVAWKCPDCGHEWW